MNEGVGLRLGPVDGGESGGEEDKHGGEDGPSVARRAGHAAQRVGEPGGNDEDGEDLEEVGERRGVLEGMGAVGVEESAAVGAQHLDGFLRGDRALADGLGLRRLLERMRDGVLAEVLRNALGDQQQRIDERAGQQDVEQRCGSYRPRSCRWCAEVVRLMPRMSATATTMPTAADQKLWVARPAISVR